MRDQFPGYYRPSEDEFQELWGDGLVVLETSVLLDLYRFSEDTREAFLDLLQSLGDRLWVPHQAAHEYNVNRVRVLSEQTRLYEKATEALVEARGRLEASLAAFRYQPVLGRLKDELHELERYLQDIAPDEYPALTVDDPMDDPVQERLTELLEAKVGTGYSEDKLAELYMAAQARYSNKVPPGFEDDKKPEPEKYGDFILWSQLLDHAQENTSPMLLVTADTKADWWWREDGQTLGPHPLLVKEFRDRVAKPFYMYTPNRFMERAGNYLHHEISAEAIEEVSTVQAADEEQEETTRRGLYDLIPALYPSPPLYSYPGVVDALEAVRQQQESINALAAAVGRARLDTLPEVVSALDSVRRQQESINALAAAIGRPRLETLELARQISEAQSSYGALLNQLNPLPPMEWYGKTRPKHPSPKPESSRDDSASQTDAADDDDQGE